MQKTHCCHAASNAKAAAWSSLSSSAAMAACVLAFLWLERLAVTKAYQRAAQRGAPKSPTVSADSLDSLGSLVRIARGPLLGWGLSMMLLFTGTLLHLPPSPAFSYLLTPSHTFMMLLSTGTLLVFPAVSSAIVSAAPRNDCIWRALFVPLGFVVFNFGDMLGRGLVSRLPTSQRVVLVLTLSRLLFVPLLLALHAARAAAPAAASLAAPAAVSAAPPALSLDGAAPAWLLIPLDAALADVLPMATLLLVAASNGWLVTAIFVRAPAALPPAERQAAGALLTLWLNAGLVAGSLGSVLVAQLAGVGTADPNAASP